MGETLQNPTKKSNRSWDYCHTKRKRSSKNMLNLNTHILVLLVLLFMSTARGLRSAALALEQRYGVVDIIMSVGRCIITGGTYLLHANVCVSCINLEPIMLITIVRILLSYYYGVEKSLPYILLTMGFIKVQLTVYITDTKIIKHIRNNCRLNPICNYYCVYFNIVAKYLRVIVRSYLCSA